MAGFNIFKPQQPLTTELKPGRVTTPDLQQYMTERDSSPKWLQLPIPEGVTSVLIGKKPQGNYHKEGEYKHNAYIALDYVPWTNTVDDEAVEFHFWQGAVRVGNSGRTVMLAERVDGQAVETPLGPKVYPEAKNNVAPECLVKLPPVKANMTEGYIAFQPVVKYDQQSHSLLVTVRRVTQEQIDTFDGKVRQAEKAKSEKLSGALRGTNRLSKA